jgi:hypothetical protein
LFVIPFSSSVAAYSHRANIQYRVGVCMRLKIWDFEPIT